MSGFINYNGKLLPSDEPIISADNRGFRYGDGIFETMRMVDERIPLWHLHAERLFNGLKQLEFDLTGLFTAEMILEEILKLCKKNSTLKSARIRLSIFRRDGGLYDVADETPNFIIQSWAIGQLAPSINENGLVIDIYPKARKSCDPLANLKSNSFLPYSMAAQFAKQNRFDDCLVLNSNERIADSTIANVFIRKGFVFRTPPLAEGCIAGVMRRWLIEQDQSGNQIKEEPLTIDELLEADEIFLTNAVQGIRWVSAFRDRTYKKQLSPLLYTALHKNLFA